jgi:hypothetical protein
MLHVECQSRGTAACSGYGCEAAIVKAKERYNKKRKT